MDPSLTVRRIADDEFLPFARAIARVFLEPHDDEEAGRWQLVCPTDRCVGVEAPDGTFVGTSGSIPMHVSVPDGQPAACAGITAVTVRPDWRRQGLLTAMMQQLLEDARDAGEPFAALFASEGEIYGRYGFGPATSAVDIEVSRDALATVGGEAGGVQLVGADEAKQVLPQIATDHLRLRGGGMLRPDAWWSMWLDHNQEATRDGSFRDRWHAVVPGRGYAVFRGTEGDWANRRPDGVIRIEELVANDAAATAALWSFIASIDLVATIRAPRRPVADPVSFLVANEAAVDTRPSEPLWLRLVDLPAALTSRGYAVTDRVVLEVADDQLPANVGRWLLDVGPDGAVCTRTDAEPDVSLTTSRLATLVLGGYPATMLADAGRLPGTDADVVRRLTRLFAVDRPPWCSFGF